MTLEELTAALGLDTDENKDKASVLKKEYNASQKELNKAKKELEKLQAEGEATKQNLEYFEAVKKAFGLDFKDVEDIDKLFDDKKEEIAKAAGGGATPEDIKELNREIAKLKRENDKYVKENTTLSENLAAEKNARIDNLKRTTLRKAFEKNNVINPDIFVKAFLDRTNVDKDEKTVTIVGDDGSELSPEDYIADWAKDEANAPFVKKDISGGFGSTGGKGKTGKPGEVSPIMQKVLQSRGLTTNKQEGTSGDAGLVAAYGIHPIG